ncbi:MAG: TonB-dependent receptor domain-containing protein [Janthinobacterium lividum]
MVDRRFRRRMLMGSFLAGVVAVPAAAQVAGPVASMADQTGSTQTTPPPVSGSNAAEPGTQTPDSAPLAPTSTDDVVVTGSLIKNANITSVAPVTTIGQTENILRGSINAEQIIRDIPGVVPNVGSQVNNGNGGASFADLRGLGTNRNLVLIDGQRIAPANFGGAVDLNNIPVALVERTDVLTGGASTTYGADAISGVINFITRSDFAGVDAQVQKGITDQGDGALTRVDLTVGGNFADDKGNAVVSIGYQLVDPIYQGDRNFSSIAIDSFDGSGVSGAGGSGTTVPGRFTVGNATRQIDPTTGALVATYARYNFNPFNLLQTPFKRYNIYAAGHYDVSDAIQFYTRGLFSKNVVDTIVAPSGIFGSSITVPYSNPYLPAAARTQFCTANGLTTAQCTAAAAATSATDPNYRTFNTSISRRMPEVGNRQSEYTTTLFDYKAGMRGQISSHLSYDINGGYGESENVQATSGYVLTSRVRQAALATNTTTCLTNTLGCVPLNLFGANGSITPAQAAFLTASSTISEKTSLAQAHAQITGDFGYTSPFAKAPISFAVGGEYRRYTAQQRSDSLAQSGDLGGFGSAPPNFTGAYSVYEGFAELDAPLVSDRSFFQELELQTGYRRSQYRVETANSPSFGTDTYKVGLNWTPVSSMKFRGNYQRAVRAPNIGELFSPLQTVLTNYASDPCAGARPTASANLRAVCLAQGAPAAAIGIIETPSAGQPNITTGGNANLRPETSDSYTFGAVFQPTFVPRLTITADYFNIKVRNAITTPTPGDIINACFGDANGGGVTAGSATSTACTAIRRDPTTGQLSGDTTTVGGLFGSLSNLGRLNTDGIDLKINYTQPFSFGKLNLSFAGTWTDKNVFQATPTSIARNCTGYYGVDCGSIQPRFTWLQRSTLTIADVDFSVLWRHLNPVSAEPGTGAFVGVPSGLVGSTTSYNFNRIGAYNYFDLSARIGVRSNLDLTITASNILDRDPPFVGYDIGATAFNSGNTYPSTYDPLGRRLTVTAHLKF